MDDSYIFNKQLKEPLAYINKISNDPILAPIKNAIYLYTGDMYTQINKELKNEESMSHESRKIVNLIDLAFKYAPPIKDPIMVYRGIQAGNLIKEINQYISTSRYQKVGLKFSGKYCCLLRITVVPGSKILPIKGLSKYPNEDELLIPHWGNMILTRKSYIGTKRVYDLVYTPENTINLSRDESPIN